MAERVDGRGSQAGSSVDGTETFSTNWPVSAGPLDEIATFSTDLPGGPEDHGKTRR